MGVCDFVKLGSLRCVAKAFRVVEFCFVLLLLLWISTRLPFAVRISGEYFRQLVGVMLSPVFSFILCNFIVLTLLLKYRSQSAGDSSVFYNVAGAELYGSFLENAEFSTDFSSGNSSTDTVYEDKQTIFEESTVTNYQESYGSEETGISVKLRRSETEKCLDVKNSGHVSPETLMKSKVPRRAQSEKMNKENVEEIAIKLQRSETEKFREITNSGDVSPEILMKSKVPRRTQSEKLNKENMEEEISVKLQRSETEKCRKMTKSGQVSPATSLAYEVDELSNEEFQKAIENYIAKQTKFHQQEKLAIVLHTLA